jgi:hypothetical protein
VDIGSGEAMGHNCGGPHSLQVRLEVLIDEDLADRRANAGKAQSVRRQDILGFGELSVVEVENIYIPGAAEL